MAKGPKSGTTVPLSFQPSRNATESGGGGRDCTVYTAGGKGRKHLYGGGGLDFPGSPDRKIERESKPAAKKIGVGEGLNQASPPPLLLSSPEMEPRQRAFVTRVPLSPITGNRLILSSVVPRKHLVNISGNLTLTPSLSSFNDCVWLRKYVEKRIARPVT